MLADARGRVAAVGVMAGFAALACVVLAAGAFAQAGGGDVAQARKRLDKRFQERLAAATQALNESVGAGMPVGEAEELVNDAVDCGLPDADLGGLGKRVGAFHAQGLRGPALAAAVHEEIRRRKEQRDNAREQRWGKTDEAAEAMRGKGQGRSGNGGNRQVRDDEGRKGQGQGNANRQGQGQGGGNSQGKGGGNRQGQGGGRGRGR